MRRATIAIYFLVVSALALVGAGQARAGWETDAAVDSTAREEAAGKAVWERLQAKQTSCSELGVGDYENLGEYFMGLMLGDTKSHEAMNRSMALMMGEEGEEQMHVAMGKRLSACDPTAAYAPWGRSYVPNMMGMMGAGMMYGAGSWGSPYGMMGFGTTSAFWTGWITQLLMWTVLVLAVIALASWLKKQGRK